MKPLLWTWLLHGHVCFLTFSFCSEHERLFFFLEFYLEKEGACKCVVWTLVHTLCSGGTWVFVFCLFERKYRFEVWKTLQVLLTPSTQCCNPGSPFLSATNCSRRQEHLCSGPRHSIRAMISLIQTALREMFSHPRVH